MNQEKLTVNGRKLSYVEVADALRERIHSGDLKAGNPMPTQTRLAGEFGVERGTIRKALRVLQEEGLLTGVTRGAPARIADTPPGAPAAPEQAQPTMVSLGPRITTAFAEPQVRIDAVSLTSESLTIALGEPLRQIHEGRIRPETVEARILLPSREIALAFPTPVVDPTDDGPVHERWLAQRNSQGQVLRHNLLALRRSHGIDVRVTFRALPFTPPVKLYLLNGSEALFGYYMIQKREEEIEDVTTEMYDTLGLKSLLFSFGSDEGARNAKFVEESQTWFNALWNTITSDLTLS
ncbi:winged helix-turn-helix domain-containing protein [Streptomyces spiramyceticus]|uniref:GntR family transcriptional regulator n=1 Tax=Streptomyces spiramyceticus TaxID=299717 RepID=UPI00237AFCFB|nr:winged helix-turn-helix domain-containing protein [Streptomyces spiramyceticus]